MTVAHRRGKRPVRRGHTPHHPNGRVERIRLQVPPRYKGEGGAQQFERSVLADMRAGIDPRAREEITEATTAEVPTVAAL
jgi:hypothetical protein